MLQVIKRSLTRGKNSCEWHLDGKKSTDKVIQALVGRTGAQIGNLCTFLPQEKVGEFSGFDSIQLLKECEKAVGGPELFKDHETLTEMEKDLGGVERQIESKQQRVDQLQEQNKALERDRDKMEQREQHLKTVDLCKKRLLWVAFEESQTEVVAVREKRDAAVKNLQETEARLAPLKDQAKTAQAALMKQDKKVDTFTKEVDPLRKLYQNTLNKVAKALEAVEGYREEIDNLGTREKEAQRKVTAAKQALEQKKGLLAQHDGEAVKREVEQLKEKLKKSTEIFLQSDSERTGVMETYKEANAKAKAAKAALAALGDANGKRIHALQQNGGTGADAVRLREWLDAEGNRGKFRGGIYGPVALELEIIMPQYLDLLEKQIPFKVLTGFVVENNDDYRLLKGIMAQKNMDMNTYDIGGGLKPLTPSHSAGELNALVKIGFQGFLEEAVQCGDVVKQVLRDHANLHRCLIGDMRMMNAFNENKSSVQNLLMGGQRKGFVGFMQNPDNSWSSLRGAASAYQNGEVNISVNFVGKRRLLEEGEDPRERQGREATLDKMNAVMNDCKARHETAKKKTDELKAKKEKHLVQYEQRRKDLTIGKRLLSDINSHQAKLSAAQEEAAGLDVNKERKVLTKKVAMAVNKRLEGMEAAQTTMASMLDVEARLGLARLSLEMAKDVHAAKKRELEREKQAMEETTHEVNRLKAQFKIDKDNLRKVRQEADEGAPIFEVNSSGEKVDTPLRALLDAMPIDRPTVTANRETAQEAADAIHDNPAVIIQFNQRKQEIAKLQKEVAAMQGSGGGARAEFDALRDKWVTTIRRYTEKLNVLFSSYMKQLQYEGSCEVNEAGTAFDKWGLNLRVAYRKGQTPVLLKKTVQSVGLMLVQLEQGITKWRCLSSCNFFLSYTQLTITCILSIFLSLCQGGERSVATIMFLMALQDMVKSPFRVVDEINQGMDERNERLVFRRIVENSVGSSRPQYFLITPKLLQGLPMDHEDVTVLFVFNGPWCVK
jgi:chromosome segregation ATPase